jgi:hypothetical protein
VNTPEIPTNREQGLNTLSHSPSLDDFSSTDTLDVYELAKLSQSETFREDVWRLFQPGLTRFENGFNATTLSPLLLPALLCARHSPQLTQQVRALSLKQHQNEIKDRAQFSFLSIDLKPSESSPDLLLEQYIGEADEISAVSIVSLCSHKQLVQGLINSVSEHYCDAGSCLPHIWVLEQLLAPGPGRVKFAYPIIRHLTLHHQKIYFPSLIDLSVFASKFLSKQKFSDTQEIDTEQAIVLSDLVDQSTDSKQFSEHLRGGNCVANIPTIIHGLLLACCQNFQRVQTRHLKVSSDIHMNLIDKLIQNYLLCQAILQLHQKGYSIGKLVFLAAHNIILNKNDLSQSPHSPQPTHHLGSHKINVTPLELMEHVLLSRSVNIANTCSCMILIEAYKTLEEEGLPYVFRQSHLSGIESMIHSLEFCISEKASMVDFWNACLFN